MIKHTLQLKSKTVHTPKIVIEGVSFPSLNRVSLSIFAKGSLGLGSLGVPSTLAHFPTVLSHPTITSLCFTHVRDVTCRFAPWRTMDSRTLTPALIVTPVPIETVTVAVGSMLAVG
uniref:Uncharacterized protein n=1 Tax=Gouania willdenowi TaxID=441366 RepID=A0A8C5DUD7_GOUWI